MLTSQQRHKRRSASGLCHPRWLLPPSRPALPRLVRRRWRWLSPELPRGEQCPEHPVSRAAGLGGGSCLAALNGLFLLQDLEKESDTPLQQVSIEEILEEQRVEQQAKQESEKLKVQALKERGLSVPRADTLDEY